MIIDIITINERKRFGSRRVVSYFQIIAAAYNELNNVMCYFIEGITTRGPGSTETWQITTAD